MGKENVIYNEKLWVVDLAG